MSEASVENSEGSETQDAALVAVLLEIERHIAADGWDQPARLFALVSSAELSAAEPALAERLGVGDDTADLRPADALTAVEQDEFAGESGGELTEVLAQISWPDTVLGCAVSMVRTFLPSGVEAEIPDAAEAAARYVNEHPDRQEIRVVVGVDRAGHQHGLARLASQPGELLAAEDLIPGLGVVLAHTLT